MIVAVKHNIEVAHRLFSTPGKCEAIHGHSMWVTLRLVAHGLNTNTGIAETLEGKPLEFGAIKRQFREYLDTNYDHKVLLNKEDPFAGALFFGGREAPPATRLPGLYAVPGDPSTENISRWIAEWAATTFELDVQVETWETSVNMASVNGFFDPLSKEVYIA